MSKFGSGFSMPRGKRGAYKKKLSPPMAKAVVKIVDRKIHANEEDKYFDLNQIIPESTVATNSSGSIVLLSGVQQGLTFATRIGETINPRRIEWRFDCTAQRDVATAAVFFTNFRVIVFQDKQIRTSTLPLITDLLETAVYNSPLSHIGINNKRFNILYDRLYSLDPYYLTSSAPLAGGLVSVTTHSSQRMMKKLKLRGKIGYTNPTTGTQQNNIYVMFLSDQGTVNAPAVNMYSRLIYEDA